MATTYLSISSAALALGINRYRLRYWRHRLAIPDYPMPEDGERRRDRRRRYLIEDDVLRLRHILTQQASVFTMPTAPQRAATRM